MDFETLRKHIENAQREPALIEQTATRDAVEQTIDALDSGKLRVAEPPPEPGGDWTVNAWAKQAILYYFKLAEMQTIESPPFEYYDKIPLKRGFESQGVRVVPPATVRRGSFIERGAVLMPSYINIGAYVGTGSMIDTWATVGSCAQIGAGVHLSGGVGIGGVLEPPGAQPVIIEDGAFVGSRCIVVEGVRVEREAVLGANVVLTASTPIIDVTGGEERVLKGRVPPRSVVVAGTRPKDFAAGTYNMTCALIIGQRKASTDRKTSLNDVLREFAVSV
ncbi:MAG: 2,3,4,5-tetrahydropyridine-2,6-dicarboxylate N-succinyltransferase [Myxococcales bacterium]|nr:2,3,4,5-tetrahydropyridine-2,6-dicarboxylate N-succinyltransferase [Myxococcales bacterium]